MARVARIGFYLGTLLPALLAIRVVGQETTNRVPEPLTPWMDWVIWDVPQYKCPSPFNDSDQKICIWPAALEMKATAAGAEWQTEVRVFAESWVPLPGDNENWPQNVEVNGQAIPVVEQNGSPAVFMAAGSHKIQGVFQWPGLPEKITIPKSVGIVRLTLEETPVANPNWDENGLLWLKRGQANVTEQDQISLKVYRVIEDGWPIWLRTQVDVIVSGKSREEDLGYLLPEGWQLSYVSSPIPVAVDEQGRVKAQVRAGTWQVRIDAFRNEELTVLQYSAAAPPAVASELIALRTQPAIRAVELLGGNAVDVNLTTFPQPWRDLPLFEWNTSQVLSWKVKGAEAEQTQSDEIAIARQMWLEDNGSGMIYQDQVQGKLKRIARLDVAPDHEVAVVRIAGTRQLITANAQTGAHGIELRVPAPNMEAIGRVATSRSLSATGWQVDADSLSVMFWLPPGWRMFALFGADRVEGDWLTSWTLLDLFLLLIFSLAVYRLWGISAGAIAFIAFGLSYHEPGSLRVTWLFLLVPVAILHVVGSGRLANWLNAWRIIAFGLLLLHFIPFVVLQVQTALYPQLEPVGIPYRSRSMFEGLYAIYNAGTSLTDVALDSAASSFGREGYVTADAPSAVAEEVWSAQQSNMQFEPGTSIQTGIARPDWRGNQVHCVWDGPVSRDQTIRPYLISSTAHRMLTIVRLLFLGLLLRLFIRRPAFPLISRRAGQQLSAASVAAICLAVPNFSFAQIPDAETLDILRERLMEPSDAFPHAAEIPALRLTLRQDLLAIEAQVHAAIDCAVPLPGQFPAWSPLRVRLDDQDAVICRREDGHLWMWVAKGTHKLTVDGLLGDAAEWVCPFALVPRMIEVDAPEWTVTGLRPQGQPESQLFFARKDQLGDGNSRYDQKNFRSVALIDRVLEIGLVWKVHNTVTRLSEPGKAISLQIPLLAGERVLTPNIATLDGTVEINLGASAQEFHWESELQVQNELLLEAQLIPQAVERWSLRTSPVWNVTASGLLPMYQADQSELTPIWRPWPGNQVLLSFHRPAPVPGKLLTIQQVIHNVSLGHRQRSSSLEMRVESSLGSEFPVGLPESANIKSLRIDAKLLPIRRDGSVCLVPLQPGSQNVQLEWDTDVSLTPWVSVPAISLPTDAANISTQVSVPESRWVLWAGGPVRGPAVRFWIILVVAIGAAWLLSRHSRSPLRLYEWLLLTIGLTQIHVAAGLIVVMWQFLLARRGKSTYESLRPFTFNAMQVGLAWLTVVSLGILIVVVSKGLLGYPEMFIVGNGSYANRLVWFEPNSAANLTQPRILAVSIWYYRLLMLAWALWLANAILRWLQTGWKSFTFGGGWRSFSQSVASNDVIQATTVSTE